LILDVPLVTASSKSRGSGPTINLKMVAASARVIE
jgi:hypothetical protein